MGSSQQLFSGAQPSMGGYDVVRDKIEEAVAAVIDGADMDETLADLQENADETLTSLARDTGR